MKMCYRGKNDPIVSSKINNYNQTSKGNKYEVPAWMFRIFFFLLSAIALSSSTYFNSKLQCVKETFINKLNHQEIIYEQSKSPRNKEFIGMNKDVLYQVQLLQEQLQNIEDAFDEKLRNVEKALTQKLKNVEDDFDIRLKKNMGEFYDIISEAQVQIQSEVKTAHHGVESFVRTTQEKFTAKNSLILSLLYYSIILLLL